MVQKWENAKLNTHFVPYRVARKTRTWTGGTLTLPLTHVVQLQLALPAFESDVNLIKICACFPNRWFQPPIALVPSIIWEENQENSNPLTHKHTHTHTRPPARYYYALPQRKRMQIFDFTHMFGKQFGRQLKFTYYAQITMWLYYTWHARTHARQPRVDQITLFVFNDLPHN